MARMDDSDYLEDDLYDDEDEDTEQNKFLTFKIGDQDYGIEIVHEKSTVNAI